MIIMDHGKSEKIIEQKASSLNSENESAIIELFKFIDEHKLKID